MKNYIFMTVIGYLADIIYNRLYRFYHGGYPHYKEQLIRDVSAAVNYNINVVERWRENLETISPPFIPTKEIAKHLIKIYFNKKINDEQLIILFLGKTINNSNYLYGKIKKFSADDKKTFKKIKTKIVKIIFKRYYHAIIENKNLIKPLQKIFINPFFVEELSYFIPEKDERCLLPEKLIAEGYYI